jgi:hypothetical protein
MTEEQYAQQIRESKFTHEELVVFCAALLKHQTDLLAELEKIQKILRESA